jgi:radical SAM superfamily enzyme YgiQ (UPF0313 family)
VKVLLISANTETTNMPTLPLGLACVAAATRRAGHEVVLVNLMFQGDTTSAIRDSIQDFRPGVIGVSVRNIDDQNMEDPKFLLAPVRQVVANCRSLSSAPIVLGGAGYSIFPESALRYLDTDLGIQGEGEAVFPALLERMASRAQVSDLPGICLPGRAPESRSFRGRLDDLPLPEPGLWIPAIAGRRELWVPVQSRRGCPMDCSFCSTSMIEGRSIRRRSPDRVVRWLADLSESGARNFSFVDNTFNLPPCYAKELCRKIIQAGLDISLWCIIYPKWIDPELVELLRKAGCGQISFGFESGSDRMLGSFNKRFNKEEVRAVSKMFQEAGIERRGFLLLGGPGETKDTVEESLSFADSLNLDYLKITAGLRIYPETPLARTALAEGVIEPGEDLLWPRFYMAPQLRDWLPERVRDCLGNAKTQTSSP